MGVLGYLICLKAKFVGTDNWLLNENREGVDYGEVRRGTSPILYQHFGGFSVIQTDAHRFTKNIS